MKVSYNWLQEYFDESLPAPEELGDIITFHAFEVEDIEKVGDDYIIDIDVLPNRSSDALSHRGIAREIATLLDRDMKYDPLREETLEMEESEKLTVEIEDNKLCTRYVAAVIEGVKVGPSPKRLKRALEALGQRSINNVVDATNYVMQNTGQPLHAFDMDKLKGEQKKIVIRSAKTGEKITTLTDDEYELDESVLLIVDGNAGAPIGIAGVKGGKSAEVDDNTKNIVIEAAHFDRASVRKTAQKLKLWTDASTRFQNGPSQHLVGYAIADVVELILDIAGGTPEGAVDICCEETDKESVSVSLQQINNLLGTKLSSTDVEGIFKRFDFEFETAGESFTVIPPFERTDINIYEDGTYGAGGTSLTPLNSNRNSANVSTGTFEYDAAITGLGNKMLGVSIGDSSNPGRTEGGNNKRENEIILKESETYIWNILSHSAGNIVSYRSSFYEHVPTVTP